MYRVVHNTVVDRYRIEKRELLGWNFIIDQATGLYLEFSDMDQARAWICEHTSTTSSPGRRWQVVPDCGC
ncbi:MAG: hypothetical protein KDI88_06490 [Gammaproteobacteria bacterium]|nr:hypothetical protein [Gammaproteobacteria bacterium]